MTGSFALQKGWLSSGLFITSVPLKRLSNKEEGRREEEMTYTQHRTHKPSMQADLVVLKQ